MENNWNGYSLFNDIEDFKLRSRNRGIVMANILEDNMKDGVVTAKTLRVVKEYLGCINMFEREKAVECLYHALKERGHEVHNNGME